MRPARVSLLVLLLAGCATAPPTVKLDSALILDCATPNARVYVDETLVGSTRELNGHKLLLTSGAHRVEVRAPDHFTTYLDVKLAHEVVQKKVALRPVPPGDPGE